MTPVANRFVDHLRSFNRKERFFLVGWALDNREFRLGPTFRRQISSVAGISVMSDSFVAMDYHLDWIHASVFLSATDDIRGVHPNSDGLIVGNQEDIDLVIASPDGDDTHLIMVEAKGVTGWTNDQMSSKANRLQAIFGQDGERWPGIRPYFVLASPKESHRLDCNHWPGWMKRDDGRPYWIKMEIPSGLSRVTRCNESGKVSREGRYWKVVASPPSPPDRR